MNNNQKAINMLASKDIEAKEENDTVYICIDDVELELAEDEIIYQANCFDKYVAENGENPS